MKFQYLIVPVIVLLFAGFNAKAQVSVDDNDKVIIVTLKKADMNKLDELKSLRYIDFLKADGNKYYFTASQDKAVVAENKINAMLSKSKVVIRSGSNFE